MFRGANLAGADLSWSDVDLHWEENLNPDFGNADLYAANLSRLTLLYADFSGANLRRASLVHATLDGDLTDADFREADLRNVEFFNRNEIWWSLFRKSKPRQRRSLRSRPQRRKPERDANLEGANLSRANLMGADLFNANLNGADLKGTLRLWEPINRWLRTFAVTPRSRSGRTPLRQLPQLIVGRVPWLSLNLAGFPRFRHLTSRSAGNCMKDTAQRSAALGCDRSIFGAKESLFLWRA